DLLLPYLGRIDIVRSLSSAIEKKALSKVRAAAAFAYSQDLSILAWTSATSGVVLGGRPARTILSYRLRLPTTMRYCGSALCIQVIKCLRRAACHNFVISKMPQPYVHPKSSIHSSTFSAISSCK